MEYTPMAIWGRELKHYRQAAGLTRAELAQRINYSTSLISQIETGQVPATVEFADPHPRLPQGSRVQCRNSGDARAVCAR